MTVEITKIQFLAHQDSGHPIFYCHAEDEGHFPELSVADRGKIITISTGEEAFKVKANPQRKNRVDVYMPIEAAKALGEELLSASSGADPQQWGNSNTNPHAEGIHLLLFLGQDRMIGQLPWTFAAIAAPAGRN